MWPNPHTGSANLCAPEKDRSNDGTTTHETAYATSLHADYDEGHSLREIFIPERAITPEADIETTLFTDNIFTTSPQHIEQDIFSEEASFHLFNNEIQWGETPSDNGVATIDKGSLTDLTGNSRSVRHEQIPLARSGSGTNSPNSSSSSSLVVLTPANDTKSNSESMSSGSGGALSGDSISTEQLYREAANRFGGPCSNAWQLPQWRTRKSKKRTTKKQARKRGHDNINEQCRRRPYEDPQQREMTALTRRLKACVRCRMQKIRCIADPDDLFGSCLTCKSVTGPTMSKLNCLRYIITDALLYREQDRPFHMWSKRWKTMDLVDIQDQDWASDEIKTITISQIFLNAPYQVKVRKFIPQEGDMIEDAYFQNGRLRRYEIPPYALADLEGTAAMFEDFIDRNIGVYIHGAIGGEHSDPLILETYLRAFKHYGEAQTPKERELMLDTFRLWVACRKTSNPEHIYGSDKLGAPKVRDPGSSFNGVVPMPVIMIAQMELIMFSRILRPVSKRVLDSLNALVLDQKPCYWYTIYLCCFVLFHSCAMLTRRDEETARQYNLKERFANGYSIQAHHSGAQTMLAHWHYVNKGSRPFQKALISEGLKEVQVTAQLTDAQAEFIGKSAIAIRTKEGMMKDVREWVAFGNDWYWISQLYEENWSPGETA